MTPPLDPRRQRTRARVLTAARAVMRRAGVGGTTVDAIADEAGVARSTVYRNWSSLDDLLADAVDEAAPVVRPAAEGSARRQVHEVVVQLAEQLDHSEWSATLPAVVAAAEASPALAGRYRAFTEARREGMRRVLDDGVRRGDVPADAPLDDVIDAIVGPLFYRRLIRRVPVDAAWATRHADRVLDAYGVAERPRRRRGARSSASAPTS